MEKTILIVDDEEDIRDLLSLIFKKQGFDVFTAANGTLGFEQFQKHPTRVVLTDFRMPSGTGVELLTNIRTRSHQSPSAPQPVVIVMTGFSDVPKEELYDLGADAVIAKPFHREEIVSAVLSRIASKEELWSTLPTRTIQNQLQFSLGPLESLEEGAGLSLGQGGFCICAEHLLLQLESEVEFTISLDDPQIPELKGTGIVRWVKSQRQKAYLPGCGIEFRYLKDSSRQSVLNYIQSNRPIAFIPMKKAGVSAD